METLQIIWENFYFQCVFKIILVVILSGIIGMERSSWNKPAGFRTHTLLGISAVLVVLCGEALSQKYSTDPFRIAAQFLSGIGFLGAGTILRDGFNVKGLTTASGLLTVSCIGLCVGTGFYLGAILATILAYLILSYSYIFTDKLDHFEIVELELDTKVEVSNFIISIEKILEKYELELKQIKDITDIDNEYNSVKIVCKYNNKTITKNKIITELATLENLSNVNEIYK